MSNELPVLNNVHIPDACPVAWDSMTGDDESRHCAQCDKFVFHLSNMTAAEAAAVVNKHGGDLCARGVFRKSDGRLLTRSSRRDGIVRFARRAITLAIVTPLVALVPGCSRESLPGPIGEWLARESEVQEPINDTGNEVCEEGGVVVLD